MNETETFVRLTSEALDAKLVGYTVVGEIGHGSMGIVFEAKQRGVARRVAIKVLPPALALRGHTVRRFLREAEAMGRLGHPNIVDIYEVGSVDELHYFAMRFVEGPPLDEVVKAGPMAVSDVVQIGIDVSDALAHAHARGVLHRDIKPSNLLRDGERVVLTDFGLARQLDAAASAMTESGDIVGTPLYMSPEQIGGQLDKIDGRSDVWGLGATLYELLLQRPPFQGSNASAILSKILHKDPALLRRQRDDVPRDLEAVVLKCLEKDPQRRYSGAAALAEDLRSVRDGHPVSAAPPRAFDPLVRWTRRHPGPAGALAVGALALAGASAWALRSSQRLEHQGQVIEQRTAVGREEKALTELNQAFRQWQSADRMLREHGADLDAERRAILEQQKSSAIGRVDDMQSTFQGYPEIAIEATATLAAMLGNDELEALGLDDTDLASLGEPELREYAALFVGLGRYEDALRAHERRIQLADDNAGAWLDAARTNSKLCELAGGQHSAAGARHLELAFERADRACALAERLDDGDSLLAQALTERAWCHELFERKLEAERDLRRAVDLDPTLALAIMRLTKIEAENRGVRGPRALLEAAGEIPSDQLDRGIRRALGMVPVLSTAARALEASEAVEQVASERIGDLFQGMRNLLEGGPSEPAPAGEGSVEPGGSMSLELDRRARSAASELR